MLITFNPIMTNDSSADFYKKFKESLDINHQFPSNYTFKFIVPTDNKRIAELQRLFDNDRPQFHMKASKNDKYTSLTAVIFALDSDQIISIYKKASSIKDVIML